MAARSDGARRWRLAIGAGVPAVVFGLATAVVLGGQAVVGAAGSELTPVAAEVAPGRPLLPHTDLATVTRPGFAGRDLDCTAVKCVAITFDDGPGAQTSALLQMLRRAGAVATWFPVGQVAADHPERLRAIAAAGHEIGNHSWSHPPLTTLGDADVDRQVSRTADAVERAIGRAPTLVRPPYGSISARIQSDLARLGAPAILWDVDPLDWKYRDAAAVHAHVMDQVRPGSIVLLHDIHASTVAAVPRLLASLADEDYTFVTVSELFGGRLHPGRVYTDRAAAYRAP